MPRTFKIMSLPVSVVRLFRLAVDVNRSIFGMGHKMEMNDSIKFMLQIPS